MGHSMFSFQFMVYLHWILLHTYMCTYFCFKGPCSLHLPMCLVKIQFQKPVSELYCPIYVSLNITKNCFWVITAKYFFPISQAKWFILFFHQYFLSVFFVNRSVVLSCNHQRPVFAFGHNLMHGSMRDYPSRFLKEEGNTNLLFILHLLDICFHWELSLQCLTIAVTNLIVFIREYLWLKYYLEIYKCFVFLSAFFLFF